MSKKNEDDILAVIEKVLELTPGSLNLNDTADKIENWDSMGHLGILVALDKLFDGQVASIGEIAEADSVLKIIDALKKHNLI
jgi:acyl carrier protein